MTGKIVYLEDVFEHEYETHGEVSPYEIEDIDGVTCYEENNLGVDGWYATTEITFRFGGKKYSIERTDHVSDNVGDTDFGDLREVEEKDELSVAINSIIKDIEDETLGSWEELVEKLERLKKDYSE